jgi:hypothetical protein
MFGSDDTGSDSSLVGRRKEIPLLSLPVAGGPSVKCNTVNDTLITELSHQRWRGRISLVSHRPGDRLDADGRGGVHG